MVWDRNRIKNAYRNVVSHSQTNKYVPGVFLSCGLTYNLLPIIFYALNIDNGEWLLPMKMKILFVDNRSHPGYEMNYLFCSHCVTFIVFFNIGKLCAWVFDAVVVTVVLRPVLSHVNLSCHYFFNFHLATDLSFLHHCIFVFLESDICRINCQKIGTICAGETGNGQNTHLRKCLISFTNIFMWAHSKHLRCTSYQMF